MAQVVRRATGKQQNSGATDSLSFLDLFYAVPVGDLAVRLGTTHFTGVTAADWSTIAVEIAVLLFSWVGLHVNRAEMVPRTPEEWFISNLNFASLRFFQFCLEVFITSLYFVIGLTLKLPQSGSPPALPSERWVLATLWLIWLTYVVWDELDIHIAGKNDDGPWKHKAKVGRNVSIVFFFLFGGMFAIEWTWQATSSYSILTWNLAALVVLYLYRTTQQWAKAKWAGTRPPEERPMLCRRVTYQFANGRVATFSVSMSLSKKNKT